MNEDTIPLPSKVLGGMPPMPSLAQSYGDAKKENADAMTELGAAKDASSKARLAGKEKIGEIQKNAPAQPELAKLPDEFKHKGMDDKQMTDTLQTMFVFAALGGAMTRTPMTTAIKAFGGAMEGLVKGDQISFQREAATFDKNLKLAMTKNSEAMSKYKLAFEKHKGDLGAAMQEIQLEAAAHNDTVTGALARANNAKAIMSQIQAMQKTDQQMQQTQQKFEQMVRRQDQQHQESLARMHQQERRMDIQQEAVNLRRNALKNHRESQKPLTQDERKTGLYYSQMAGAETQIADIIEKGFESDSFGSQLGAKMAGSDWLNWATPEEAQRYAQSTEQWAEAYLRLKTGAATNKDEIRRNARTYFPQIGDKPDVVKQKNAMRQQAINDVRRAAGRGAEGGAPAPAAAPKAAPTQADRDWVKSHPEDAPKFKANFGVDP